MWAQIILYYVWIAFMMFLFLVALITLVNHIKRKHPEANMPDTDVTSRELFIFSLMWPRYVVRVFFRRILKPLFKKGA